MKRITWTMLSVLMIAAPSWAATYEHKEGGLAVTFPDGWTVQASPAELLTTPPQKGVFVLLITANPAMKLTYEAGKQELGLPKAFEFVSDLLTIWASTNVPFDWKKCAASTNLPFDWKAYRAVVTTGNVQCVDHGKLRLCTVEGLGDVNGVKVQVSATLATAPGAKTSLLFCVADANPVTLNYGKIEFSKVIQSLQAK
jgi:hypothetical protein